MNKPSKGIANPAKPVPKIRLDELKNHLLVGGLTVAEALAQQSQTLMLRITSLVRIGCGRRI